MIIKCPHCDGKMRVDESRLSSGERAKVRCPHCKEISSVGDPAKQPDRSESPGLSAKGPQRPVSAKTVEITGERKNAPRGKALDHEPTFPKDAFQNFKGPRSSTSKIILWIVVSLAIVGFFALFVNLMLPGPTGQRPFGLSGKTHQTSPKMPVGSEKLDPYPVQPGADK